MVKKVMSKQIRIFMLICLALGNFTSMNLMNYKPTYPRESFSSFQSKASIVKGLTTMVFVFTVQD